MLSTTRTRAGAVVDHGREWVAHQDPSSRPGVAIGAWRRYREVDGPLQSLLLTSYILLAVVPALLVMEEYLNSHPAALANHLVHHYGLSNTTGDLLRSVLVHDREHELGSALLAIAGALFFRRPVRVDPAAARAGEPARRQPVLGGFGDSPRLDRAPRRLLRLGPATLDAQPARPAAAPPRRVDHGARAGTGHDRLEPRDGALGRLLRTGLRRLRGRDGDCLLDRLQLGGDRRRCGPGARARGAAEPPQPVNACLQRASVAVAVVLVAALPGAAAAASAPVAPGTVATGELSSRAIAGPLHYSIFLPSDYAHGDKRYPVIYFLHGLPASPDAYKGIGALGGSLAKTGREAIVVGAQGAREGDTDPEWHDWGRRRNWETATESELVRFIDAHYRTIPTRDGRAIVGISGGG